MENQEQKSDFKHIVRIANTDLPGEKGILYSLRKIKGVGFMFANMACNLSKVEGSKRVGDLNDDEVNKLDSVIKEPNKFNVPKWILNRRNDYETGEDKHIILGDLKFTTDNDIKRLMKIKCYRGSRHGFGLPVRGQRTKSNFRKNKGKVSLGVMKKSAPKSGDKK
jgi:small subunit ribosomal protein S13|tara:strand:+ start:955 stop:1449 length:495 start_codon:yes stop_codon:yes gene_type:complete